MRSTVAFALLVCVATLALVATGCGGDDEPDAGTAAPSEWADDFCSAVTAWTDGLEQIGDDVGDPSSLSAESIEQAARDANAATDEFVSDLRALGAPDTESGDEIRESLETFADSVEAERDKIEEAIQDTSGITGITTAVATIGTSLSAMAMLFQTTLDTLRNADVGGELETALEESSACDEITG